MGADPVGQLRNREEVNDEGMVGRASFARKNATDRQRIGGICAEAAGPGPGARGLPRAETVRAEVTGGFPTVRGRSPAHPMARALLSAFGRGVAAPSANRFGRVSPTSAAHVRDEFGDEALFILDGGRSTVGLESTILDLSGATPALLRPGGLSVEDLHPITGPLSRTSKTRAPGTLASHYAPRTSLRLSDTPHKDAARLRATGLTVAILEATDPTRYAHDLYAELRRLDTAGVDILIAQRLQDESGLGLAINDRLKRAAAKRD